MRFTRKMWILGALFVALLFGAWWFGFLGGSSQVSVESRSMSHADVDLPGIMDPGEAVSLGRVLVRDDVITATQARARDHRVAGDWGDAIAFDSVSRGERTGVGILHRAMVWVEWDAATQAYDIPDLGLQDVRSFLFPDVGTWDARRQEYVHEPMDVELDPDLAGRHSGFLTKGDHNNVFDQDARAVGGAVGSIELVEVSRIDGRVTDFHEPDESLRTAYFAFGAALLATVAVVLWRRSGRPRLPLSGAQRCAACGAGMEPGIAFCPRCGRSTP